MKDSAIPVKTKTVIILVLCVAAVLGAGAVAGLFGLELPEPANSMIHSLMWFALAVVAAVVLRRKRVSPRFRIWWMVGVVGVIGVLMGVRPNAMGAFTHGISGLIVDGVFSDYMIGMGVVTVVMLILSKMVCGWACHLGALQELLFRLNRNKKDRRGIFRQVKLPFALTMTVRVVIFLFFIVVAVFWASDISFAYDPHRLYRLTSMATAPALVTLTLTILLSPFVYRPWCQLACPLGLLSWIMERFALLRVNVDRSTCKNCRACVKACPCGAMEGIIDGKLVRPDCWSCGTCIDRCPTGSVRFCSRFKARPHELDGEALGMERERNGSTNTSAAGRGRFQARQSHQAIPRNDGRVYG